MMVTYDELGVSSTWILFAPAIHVACVVNCMDRSSLCCPAMPTFHYHHVFVVSKPSDGVCAVLWDRCFTFKLCTVHTRTKPMFGCGR